VWCLLAVAELRDVYRGMTLGAKDRRAAGLREADSSAGRGTAASRQLAVDPGRRGL
jgi:hypothetical protein